MGVTKKGPIRGPFDREETGRHDSRSTHSIGDPPETPRAEVEQQIFRHIDESLPDETKRKLNAFDTKLIVETLTDFIYNRIDIRVLLDRTPKSPISQVSRFEPDESEEFLDELSKL